MTSQGPWSRWPARPDLVLLGGFLLFALSAWAFVEIADEVAEGESLGADRYVLRLLAARGDWPDWIVHSIVDLTALGGTAVLALVALLCALYLGASRRLASALWLALAVTGGLVLSHGLKLVFLRPRPDVFEHVVAVSTTSFPSGHAANSAVVYLTLAVILAREQDRRGLRIPIVAAGILLTILVGLSRVILAVHWPSDVLGGWALGAGWAALCAAVSRSLELRRAA